jgi:hypothetical protein
MSIFAKNYTCVIKYDFWQKLYVSNMLTLALSGAFLTA